MSECCTVSYRRDAATWSAFITVPVRRGKRLSCSEICKRNKLVRSLKDWFGAAGQNLREKGWRHEQAGRLVSFEAANLFLWSLWQGTSHLSKSVNGTVLGWPTCCMYWVCCDNGRAVTMDGSLIWGSGPCCKVQSVTSFLASVTRAFSSWRSLSTVGRDSKSTLTFGVFSISGESRETWRSDFCTLSAEGAVLEQHLELITRVSQLAGSEWATLAPTGPYVKCAHSDFQLGEAWNNFCWPSEEDAVTPFWLTGEDRLPVRVPPEPSDVVAHGRSVHVHTPREIPSSHRWGIPLIG